MRELVVIGYDDPFRADEVLNTLNRLQKDHLIDLGDAAVVIKNKEEKIHFKHFRELAIKSEQKGSWWGILLGTLFLHPGFGALLGESVGELSSSLIDFGVDDTFIKDLGVALRPDSSALFILVRHADPDAVLEELIPFGGHVLRTSLGEVDEVKLQAALEQASASAS